MEVNNNNNKFCHFFGFTETKICTKVERERVRERERERKRGGGQRDEKFVCTFGHIKAREIGNENRWSCGGGRCGRLWPTL